MKPLHLKLFAMMFLEFFIWGAWLPLIFGYLPALQFTDFQQSLVLNAFPISAILAMFFSNQFADRNFAAERFLAFSHVVGGLAILALFFVNTFWPFFILMLVHCVFYVPTISITNSIAFASMKDAQKEFGLIRMGGTIGWIAAAWPPVFLLVNWEAVNAANASGVVDWLNAVLANPLSGQPMQEATRYTYLIAGVASLLLAGLSLTLPHTPPSKGKGEEGLALVAALKLLAQPFVLILWLVTFIDSFVHNCYFNWTGRFLPTVGVPGNWVTPVMSIGQVAEILTMAVLGYALKALGWRTTLIIGILGHAVRFAIFAFCGTPEYMWLIVLINILHGICYAFFFATVYIFVDAYFPKDVRTSAQGLFNFMILGAGALAANFAGPPLMTQYTEIKVAAASAEDATLKSQVVTLNRLSSKKDFTLGFGKETTEAIKDGASADEIKATLEKLKSVGAGNVDVKREGSGPIEVTWKQALKDDAKAYPMLTGSQVHFGGLFLIPCGAALLAVVLLAVGFFPPPVAQDEGKPVSAPH